MPSACRRSWTARPLSTFAACGSPRSTLQPARSCSRWNCGRSSKGGTTGQWHGGAIAGLIDTAGDAAVALGLGAVVPTINFRVDYLRPATTRHLTATATVRRAGRTVAIVDIDVEDAEGRLVAVGRGCYGAQPG